MTDARATGAASAAARLGGAASATNSANRAPMTRDIVLEARSVSKQVSSPDGPLTIVREVSFAVTRGESVAIAGASGAGKSTLLALLAGLDSPTSGEIWLAGEPLSALDEDGRARLRAARVLSLIHISEPTRQAEISYAVFCLKKKK